MKAIIDHINKGIEVIKRNQIEIMMLKSTKTEMKNAPKKEGYLQRTFPYINIRKKLIVCSDKTMIRADVLIDDCLDNFGGQDYSIVLDYPWNRNTNNENILRASSWKEIYEILLKIKSKSF